MNIRKFRNEDKYQVEEIFCMYWNDEGFRKRLLDKLDIFIENNDESKQKQYGFYVAEENGEIVGVAGFRKAPEHMLKYSKTEKPVEFYILGSKYKNRGIGESLRIKRIEEAKRLGFTEIILYSPDSHKDSWSFHDRLGFERVGPDVAPDGEPGMIWRLEL
ncbi:MAG: GNAT family N-acetyltransferase [Candidatus Paceibacterota bacterium]